MQSEFWDVPDGKLAAVVTHLEMQARPPARRVPELDVALMRHEQADLAWYRDLFCRVGGLNWLWFSRLGMEDHALADILHHPDVWVFSVQQDGRDEGLLELDFRQSRACELAYFGLTERMIGTGAGRWLMEQALDLAWGQGIDRLHVHTCTLDSAAALPFYMRSGFRAYRRQVEIADDPRKLGLLPEGAAPQIPMI